MEKAVISLGPEDEVRKEAANTTAHWSGLALGELCVREGAMCPWSNSSPTPQPQDWKAQGQTLRQSRET